MLDIEKRAERFARNHHGLAGQSRKYTGEPYINHPAAVVKLVRSVPHTAAMLAAAWLHDVVEDTEASLDQVTRELGNDVAQLVAMLTSVSRPEDGNRAERKEIDNAHLAKASPDAKTIKLADIIDNSKSIVERDPKFASYYIEEKLSQIQVLKEGNTTLWEMAHKTLLESRNRLQELK